MRIKTKFKSSQERLDYVEYLDSQREHCGRELSDSLIASVLKTIPIEEFILLYIEGNKKRQSILHFAVLRRIENEQHDFRELFNKLMSDIVIQSKTVQENRAFVMRRMLPQLPFSYSQRLFDYLIASDINYNHTSATFIKADVWNKNAARVLLAHDLKKKDHFGIEKILACEPEFILTNLKQVWYHKFRFPEYVKGSIINTLAKKHFTHFAFLKNTEPQYYFFVCEAANKRIPVKELDKFFARLPQSTQVKYLVRAVESGDNRFIKKHLNKYLTQHK